MLWLLVVSCLYGFDCCVLNVVCVFVSWCVFVIVVCSSLFVVSCMLSVVC